MDIKSYVEGLAKRTKKAQFELSQLNTKAKDEILEAVADKIEQRTEYIINENKKDIEAGEQNGLSKALLDRLLLTETRLKKIASAVRDIVKLPDPVGSAVKQIKRPNGLIITQVRIPIGVIGIIYESRPNVTIDAAALCLKSSNSVILKGGSEAINSNRALVQIIKEALSEKGYSEDFVQFIDTTDRAAVRELLKLNEYVDLIIPRGGHGLIRYVVENSTIPVIKHDMGVCTVFVDKEADIQKALSICYNAKVQRPGVCNAMENMVVHKDIAPVFLPKMAEKFKEAGVELRGCEATRAILSEVKPATEEDWSTEYLDLILSIKVVNDVEEAIDFINRYGSHHSDAIVTENYTNAMQFLNSVDSAAVYVNASTRFTDGGEFGLGAEIGISTDRLHARGPMGLEELTTTKYVVFGNGQIRE